VDVDVDAGPDDREAAAGAVILLDTNALIWLEQGKSRTRALRRAHPRLYISPASILELQFFVESGRISLRAGTVAALAATGPWVLDDPPAASWFTKAIDVGWTRDPFDRLLVAHARLRGWRLATADAVLLERLDPGERLEI
jgi:PIN domain nuclease of toxin-antitoxin system